MINLYEDRPKLVSKEKPNLQRSANKEIQENKVDGIITLEPKPFRELRPALAFKYFFPWDTSLLRPIH